MGLVGGHRELDQVRVGPHHEMGCVGVIPGGLALALDELHYFVLPCDV